MAYNNFIQTNIIESGDKINKKFFSFIKSKKKDICGVTPLFDNKNKTHTDDVKLAEILNDQFTSVFSVDDGTSPEVSGPAGLQIGNITITKPGIVKLLKGLDPSKASGPDCISARLLKECAEEVAGGLVLLFTASLKQGKIPEDWKHAIITPLFKGGNKNRSKAENYRPISITSVTCKVLEHIIHSHIMTHFDKERTLSDNQHGFRKS